MSMPGTWISPSRTSRVIPGRHPELSGGVQTWFPIGGEDIRRGAFRDLAALVEQDHLVEAARLRVLEPRQVHRPGEDLGAGERAGGMACRSAGRPASTPVAPVFRVGRQRDDVARPVGRRIGPHAAAVAHDDQAQRAVRMRRSPRPVPAACGATFSGSARQRNVKRRGVALDARPMALPGEEHAVGDAQGA